MFRSPRLIALVDSFHESEQLFRIRLKGVANLESLVLEDPAGLTSSPVRVKKYSRSKQVAHEYVAWLFPPSNQI